MDTYLTPAERVHAGIRAHARDTSPAMPQGPLLGRVVCALSRAIVGGRSNAMLVLQDAAIAHDPVVKAAVTGHDSATASELLRVELGKTIEELRPAVPLLQMNAMDVSMKPEGSARRLPRVTVGAAGAFVGEGAPIPATSAGFDSLVFGPLKKLATLTAITAETTRAQDGPQIIERLLLDALAKTINVISLSAGVATPAAPAGLFAPANSDPAIPSTTLPADVAALAAAMAASYSLDQCAWVMHPSVALKIAGAKTAGGTLEFPFAGSGNLLGARILTSTGIVATRLGLIHEASIWRAIVLDATGLELSDSASVQMDSLPAADQGGATTNVVPTWQRDMLSIRARAWATWASERPSAVQHVEGLTW